MTHGIEEIGRRKVKSDRQKMCQHSSDTKSEGALKPGCRIVAGLVAIVALLGVLATPAFAVKVHPFVKKFDLPANEVLPGGVAVNQSTHHVYVVNFEKAIYDFDANGKLDPTYPQLTGAPSFRPFYLAVDNSGGPNNGYIYATSPNQGVQQFDPAGAATSVRIEASAIPPNGTPQAGGLPPVVNNGEFFPEGIAVDATGKVFVADFRNHAIDEFSASGAFIAQVGGGLFNGASSIAIGPGGNIYLAAGDQGLKEIDAAGNCVNACVPIDPGQAGGVAVDSAGNVLVTVVAVGSNDSSVNEYDPSGNLISSSGVEQLNTGFGIAIDEGSGKLYVGDLASFVHGPEIKADVKVFGPLLTLPDAITGSATVSGQSATVNGEVGADGGPDATCVFQYVDEASFTTSGFENAKSASCSPAGPFSGESLTAVHADLSLNAGTAYRYRLIATSSDGSTPGTAKSLTTEGPSVRAQSFSAISETSAILQATINPNSNPTSYRFEYVSEAQFAENGYADATEVPLGGGSIGSGIGDVKVAQPIGGLTPGTAYRFHVVATDEPGREASGPDSRFVTYLPVLSGLPDARAYEQASPLDKNGANVEGGTNAVQAAANGNAITFFASSGLPGGEGAQNFPIYLAQRSSAPAWSTQGLSPPAATGPQGKTLGWSEDLLWAYNNNFVPGEAGTFFARDNTSRTTTEIATGLAGIGQSSEPVPAFAGVGGDDDSVVIFEDKAKLVPTAKAGKPNVYLWDRNSGEVQLGAVLNSGQPPAQGAFAGPYGWIEGLDRGGAAEAYYTYAGHAISADASRLFFTSAVEDQLYVRINPRQPQSPLDSGGHCTDPEGACTIKVSASQATTLDPAGEQPAIFTQATPDGRFVLFMSAGKLTDDSTAGPTRDLYRYDTESGDLIDLTVNASSAADVQGVLGMSDDGSYAYFAANGDLAAGASPGSCGSGGGGKTCNVYAWHDGATTFIAKAAPSSSTESDIVNWIPASNVSGSRIEKSSRVDPGGKVLLFRSTLSLTGYENAGHSELYRAELTPSGRDLQCISCNPTNAPASGDASLQGIPEKFLAPRGQAPVLTRNLSVGGGRIFFDSPDKLVASDTNGVNDVYEWEAQGAGSCHSAAENGGCLYLLSKGPDPSYFGDASASGNDAFFFTLQSLLAQDRDQIQDVYDARVGGGIAAQNQAPSVPCLGDACAGPIPPAPEFSTPASAGIGAPGNPKTVECKKSLKKVKRKGRTVCVKPAHRKQHKGKSKRGGRAGK